jgi:electron transport complex protein RnfC
MGGPMMGITLPDDTLPVTKAMNCLIVMQTGDISPTGTEMPCIRCGECLPVCPARLLPHELLTATRQHDMGALQDLGLNACIECGCCDYVCPSQIRLTSRYIAAKAELAQHNANVWRAEHAKQRYAAHEARLTAQREAESAALEQQIAATANTDSIEAIMERTRDKEQRE